jgi:hypothetical protein
MSVEKVWVFPSFFSSAFVKLYDASEVQEEAPEWREGNGSKRGEED